MLANAAPGAGRVSAACFGAGDGEPTGLLAAGFWLKKLPGGGVKVACDGVVGFCPKPLGCPKTLGGVGDDVVWANEDPGVADGLGANKGPDGAAPNDIVGAEPSDLAGGEGAAFCEKSEPPGASEGNNGGAALSVFGVGVPGFNGGALKTGDAFEGPASGLGLEEA